MLYKLVAISAFLAINMKNIAAQDDAGEIDDTDFDSTLSIDGLETESFDGTGSLDDDDGNSYSIDGTDSISESDDTDSDTLISGDSDTSTDSDTSDDDNTSTDDDTSRTYAGSYDDDTDEDECVGLSQTACAELVDDDGDAECGYNALQQTCYSVERRAGTHGSGNFDDGYIAAKEKAAQETSQLYTVVGVLGGVVGALILVIAGGAYYLYNKKNEKFDMNYGLEAEIDGHVNGTANNNMDGDEQELINKDNHLVIETPAGPTTPN